VPDVQIELKFIKISGVEIPHGVLDDPAHPLKPWLMKPTRTLAICQGNNFAALTTN